MKFIHVADLHLGACPDAGTDWADKRRDELWRALENIVGICEQEQTDLLLIAGDLFHRQPLVRELKEVNYYFASLTHTKVVFIAGNHDFIREDSYYRTFRWSENVFPLLGKEPEYLDFPDLKTAVYGFSYHSREITDNLYDGMRAQGEEPIEILLAHGGDEKHIPVNKKLLERSGFDYIALGHIHKPHALIRNRAVYAGALEPVDCNDTGKHGFVKGEIRNGNISVMWIPCAVREYIHLEIPVTESDTNAGLRNKIRTKISECGDKNIYKIILQGSRSAETVFDTSNMKELGHILDVEDKTKPAYDFERLYRENEFNLMGKYIARFRGCEDDSTAYQALCEGVEALLANKG